MSSPEQEILQDVKRFTRGMNSLFKALRKRARRRMRNRPRHQHHDQRQSYTLLDLMAAEGLLHARQNEPDLDRTIDQNTQSGPGQQVDLNELDQQAADDLANDDAEARTEVDREEERGRDELQQDDADRDQDELQQDEADRDRDELQQDEADRDQEGREQGEQEGREEAEREEREEEREDLGPDDLDPAIDPELQNADAELAGDGASADQDDAARETPDGPEQAGPDLETADQPQSELDEQPELQTDEVDPPEVEGEVDASELEADEPSPDVTDELDSPEREADELDSPEREADELDSPEREADELDSPEREADELDSPEREADELDSPEREADEVDAPSPYVDDAPDLKARQEEPAPELEADGPDRDDMLDPALDADGRERSGPEVNEDPLDREAGDGELPSPYVDELQQDGPEVADQPEVEASGRDLDVLDWEPPAPDGRLDRPEAEAGPQQAGQQAGQQQDGPTGNSELDRLRELGTGGVSSAAGAGRQPDSTPTAEPYGSSTNAGQQHRRMQQSQQEVEGGREQA
jgi:hypothetical protein